MGLDAAVYWSVKNLPKTLLPNMYTVDEETGEFYTNEPWDHLHAEFQACHHRLTNAGGAGALDEELRALGVSDDSVLLKQVLFSGTHCGDHIPLSDVPRLEAEIEILLPQTDGRLARFLRDMRELVEVAKREQNAIVFV